MNSFTKGRLQIVSGEALQAGTRRYPFSASKNEAILNSFRRCQCLAERLHQLGGAGIRAGNPDAQNPPDSRNSNYAILSVSNENQVAAAVLGGILFVESVRFLLMSGIDRPDRLRGEPELEPQPRLNEQDCTSLIVLDGGNLKCR